MKILLDEKCWRDRLNVLFFLGSIGNALPNLLELFLAHRAVDALAEDRQLVELKSFYVFPYEKVGEISRHVEEKHING